MATGKQSLVELRGLAQSMGVKWSFSDDANSLKQKIAIKQTDMLPPPVMPVVPAPDDQRMRTLPPSKVSNEALIKEMLQPYISRGLTVTFENNHFFMRYKERTDCGTLRQPPRVIVKCAARLFE
jgi:hypothetical protein